MKNILLVCTFLFSALIANGQQVPTPREFLGYEPGDEFTLHYKVVNYFKAVAEASPSVQLEQYGETYEGRPLYVAYIGTPQNLNRLEEIRMSNLRRSGLEEGDADQDQPAVVWLSYNVHGNEASSTEASMKTLYFLANPNNREAQQWLENVIVIMDPCINPDGRDRYVNYFKRYQQSPLSVDTYSMSHQEEWPGGRVNHYLFDLNRDWLWLTQKESRERLKIYNNWLPQIHVDFHEQYPDNPYYFAPGAEPYHSIITQWQRDFQKVIGENHASYFDKNNWAYFTGEVFDLLYPSYGDTYPTFNGAIGMTYEQAGHGIAGLSVKTQYGDTLFLSDRVEHHFTTGISTIETASMHQQQLLDEFDKYFSSGSEGKYRNYIIQSNGQPDKIEKLTRLLDAHKIRYGKTTSRKKVSAFDYQTNETISFAPVSDDLIIPGNQPKSRLVQAMFEPDTYIADSVTYDITAWNLSYAYGLHAYATEADINQDLVQIPAVADYTIPSDPPYGYLVPYHSVNDGIFLAALVREKVNVGVLNKAASFAGQTFQPGSLVILRGNNEFNPGMDKIIEKNAQKLKINPVPVYTGLATSGIDLGSGNISRVAPVKIGLLAGSGTSPNRVGEVWHFFEQDCQYPITLLRKESLSERALSEFDVLFLADGSYKEQEKTLFEFIRGGGRVVALGNSLDLFADSDDFKLTTLKAASASDSLTLSNYAMEERQSVRNYIPGAIFKARMDTTHPLAYGFEGDYETLTIGSDSYVLPYGDQVAIFGENPEPLNGFAGKQALESMGGRMVLGVERFGRGEVIYFGDNPLYRSFWQQGKLLIINAVFQN